MSYDIMLLPLRDGESWEEALEAAERRALGEEEAPCKGPDLFARRRILDRIRALDPGIEVHEAGDLGFEIDDGDHGIQLALYGVDGALHMTYGSTAREGAARFERLRTLARIVEEETDLVAYDPQIDGGLDDDPQGLMMENALPVPERSWARARMGAIAVGALTVAMVSAALAMDVPRFVVYLVLIPFLLVVGVGYAVGHNHRAMVDPHPVPPKRYRIRRGIALEHAAEITAAGFQLESFFRLPSLPMSLVYLWRHATEPTIFAIYQLGLSTRVYDVVTEFTDGAELTTSTSLDSATESPERFFKQAIKDAKPGEVIAAHRAGVRFLEAHGLVAKPLSRRPVHEVWLTSVQEGFERMMSKPSWALRGVWRSATGAGSERRVPLAEQYPDGIPGPAKGQILRRGPPGIAERVVEPGAKGRKRRGTRKKWSRTQWQLFFLVLLGLAQLGGWVAGELQERQAVEMLENGPPAEALEAFAGLGWDRIGAHVESLAPLAEHEDPAVRRSLVEVLRRSSEARALEVVIELGADEDAGVREAVAGALARHVDEPGAREALTLLGEDTDAAVRDRAREVLAEAGESG